jgi:hypothetical protein
LSLSPETRPDHRDGRLHRALESYNAWYLIILGLVAIVIAIFFRRGLWGTLDDKFNIRPLPTGYYLWPAGETRRRGRRAKAVVG